MKTSKRRKISLTKTLFYRAKKIYSPEVFEIELNVIKEVLIKNGCRNPLIDRVFKTELNKLNYIKPYGHEKCLLIFILPYASEKLTQIEENLKKLTEKVYRAAKLTVIFASSFVLSPKGKNLISNKHKSCMVYTFEYWFSNSYIGQTSRHLETRIIEHIPKCVSSHISNQPKTISTATSNTLKRSSISELLIKNPNCGKSYSEMKFRILRSCNNIYDLNKIEAIYIHLNKRK